MDSLDRIHLISAINAINNRIKDIQKLYKKCEYSVDIKPIEQNADGIRVGLFLTGQINFKQDHLITSSILLMKLIDVKTFLDIK